MLAGVRAALSSHRPLWLVMYLQPGQHSSEAGLDQMTEISPNSPEMGGLTSSDLLLICPNHCRQKRLNVSPLADLRGWRGAFLKMSSSVKRGLQTQVTSAFLFALSETLLEANMQVCLLLWALKSKGTNGRIWYSMHFRLLQQFDFLVCHDPGKMVKNYQANLLFSKLNNLF